jgi:adenine phosphoribosyltransferase
MPVERRENGNAMSFHDDFVARFRWIHGHADVLGLFADGSFLECASEALAEPFLAAEVTKVVAVEARGFILGTAVALRLGSGLVPIRKEGSVHPGEKVERRTPRDWRGRESILRIQRSALSDVDRVLLVDDWAETGSQALTARALVAECGATYVGLSLLVDQIPPEVRDRLAPVYAVAHHQELGG